MSITLLDPKSCWVVCLCADWCGVCRDYHVVFEALAGRHPDLRFAWVDIEDQSDLLGEMDIQTFPTLLVLDHSGVKFQGAVAPHPPTASRLLDSLRMQGSRAIAHDSSTMRLLEVLPALPDLWISS
jgi:thioredoxin 1